jgi:hypothetical protein
MSEQAVDVFCKHCGKTFSTFLQQMAEQNAKALCPCCGESAQYSPSDIVTPGAAQGLTRPA